MYLTSQTVGNKWILLKINTFYVLPVFTHFMTIHISVHKLKCLHNRDNLHDYVNSAWQCWQLPFWTMLNTLILRRLVVSQSCLPEINVWLLELLHTNMDAWNILSLWWCSRHKEIMSKTKSLFDHFVLFMVHYLVQACKWLAQSRQLQVSDGFLNKDITGPWKSLIIEFVVYYTFN